VVVAGVVVIAGVVDDGGIDGIESGEERIGKDSDGAGDIGNGGGEAESDGGIVGGVAG
jgi:hypothetical protein